MGRRSIPRPASMPTGRAVADRPVPPAEQADGRPEPAISRRVRREVVLLAFVSLGAAVVFYLPFWLRLPSTAGIPFERGGMPRVHGMWDGPLYVTAAATLWDPNPDHPLYSWLDLEPADYAERFPLYPLAVRLLSPIGGYWNAALAINVAASTLTTLLLYAFLRRFGVVPSAAFWVALVSIFWPPRGFLYRYVAMPEPLFILGLLGAAYAFKASRFTLCGLAGALAVAARPNGFLVVAAFGLLALARLGAAPAGRRLREIWRMAGLCLMPLTLATIYLWHQHLFGDWLASVHAGGFVWPKLGLYPALTFYGIGDEGVPYLFVLALAGTYELARRRQADLALLCLMFYVAIIFVPTDVSRYLLPVLPFAFFLAGERILASPPVRLALLLSLPLIYTYAWTTLLDPGYQAPVGPLLGMLP